MPERKSELQRGIDEAYSRLADAISSRNPSIAAEVYTDEAELLAPAGRIFGGRDAIEGFWRDVLEAGTDTVRIQSREAEQHERAAYEVREVVRLDAEGAETGRSHAIVIWKYDGGWKWEPGGWKIHRDVAFLSPAGEWRG